MTRTSVSFCLGLCLIAALTIAVSANYYEYQKKWISRTDRHFDASKLTPKPESASQAFDCKARIAAYAYAKVLQPWRMGSMKQVWDALELSTLCNQVWREEASVPWTPVWKLPEDRPTVRRFFYVDPVKGSDDNPGTLSQPVKTLYRAVMLSRNAGGPNSIYIRSGTLYLSDTLRLNPQDNGLTIANYPGETVYISGGVPLSNLVWKQYNVSSRQSVNVYSNQNNVYGQVQPSSNTVHIRYLGSFDTTEQCENACLGFFAPGGIPCKSFTYHTARLGGPYARQCFGRIDETWGPTAEANINSGRVVRPNIYVADLSSFKLPEVLGLHFPNGTGRATRCRYPDGDTETVRFPAGWVLNSKSYLPAKKYPTPTTIIVQSPVRTDNVMFQQYSMGIGGPCSIFTPPESYWCSSQNAGGASGLFETPTGVTYFNTTFVGTDASQWSKPSKGVVHMWHPYHWAMWMYSIDSVSPSSQTIAWSYGGFQGARGAISGGGKGGEWYVENILELLDSPNEFYYDEDTQKLYYFYNGTSAPPSNFQLVATNLKTLIDIRGTQQEPVRNVTLFGLNFVTTAYTYLDPHGVPSGGDWGMQRSAAVYFEGTEGSTIDSCNFTRLDGNALMLSGYHREAVIKNCTFSWMGDSVVVAWGDTQGIDGTDGNQPRGTKLLDNFFYEMGMFEKQASAWFQAKSCQTLIKGNIMFNGPRALINFNDGFGGANEVTRNLIFNPNRESSDQGPFNSWDRLPFLTEVNNGTPSLTPAYNDIHHNFMLCNYGSNICVDNDDGSAYYKVHDNFEIYGGHKSDFGGHNKFTYNSVVAMAQDYQQGLCGDFNTVVPNYVDGYYNNTCVQAAVVPYLSLDECNINDPNAKTLPIVHDNRVYNTAGKAQVRCGSNTVSETEWQARGFDKNTRVFSMPSDDQIIAWGRAILNY